MPTSSSWHPAVLDSSLQERPRVPTPAPVLGKLETLPFDQLSWEDFERIQWRIMRDIEGLRSAQIYGDRGQSQYGLDVVALAPDQSGVALQSKKYKQFGPAQLNAAVEKFKSTTRPFDVDRLIIGVSREVKSTKVIDRIADLRIEVLPLELDIWDKQELSRLLREAPAIVIEFFGMPTAEAFCLPFVLDPVSVPSIDAVAVREALARTPEETTGAAELFSLADDASENPMRALELVEAGQTKLRDAGFSGHATQHESRRSHLLAALGRADEAARRILDNFWVALEHGLTMTAQVTSQRLHEIPGGLDPSCEHIAVADAAIGLYLNPLAHVPDPESLLIGDHSDQVRLAVLAGETALSSDNLSWLAGAIPILTSLADEASGDQVFRMRLKLLVAEATGDWSQILGDARKLKLGHGLGGLVTARYARRCALNQRFEEADALWDEAAGNGSLAKAWPEASTWIFSRRAYRARWRPFTSNELMPLQTALRDMGPARPIIVVAADAYQDALEGLGAHKLRSAAISAQRALRDAVATSDWVAEERARRVLANILNESEEPGLAAHHLTRSGSVTLIKQLGKSHLSHFIDVSDDLTAGNYWTVGTAFQLLAVQADLVPDNLVDKIAERIQSEIADAESGALVDLRASTTSRYGGALRALAGIANRLTVDQAESVLAHFERQPPVKPNHYRYHDEDEATAVAHIVLTQPSLVQRALRHLIPLLARAESARNSTTARAVDSHIGMARDHLEPLSTAGNGWAREVIASHDPAATPPAVARDALERLISPLIHKKGVFTMGTNAVRDSTLIRGMSSTLLEPAVAELIARANDPYVGSSDRNDYLLAASNIAGALDEAHREKYFAAALRAAISLPPSKHDEEEKQFKHRLGAMRIANPDHDSRDRAVFLAACLATSVAQRAEVKHQVYALLGAGRDSDYWLTRAFQELGDALKDDLGFLVSQGWGLRSLAGILWPEHGGQEHIGVRLSGDSDARVRRALAGSLANSAKKDSQARVREQLAHDCCYSVRNSLAGNNSN